MTDWIVFGSIIFLLLILDLGLFHRESKTISIKDAVFWSCLWIVVSLFFCVGVYYYKGTEPALNFLTGYLLEKSLSVDNLFVFLLIFRHFCVPQQYMHKVLFWGIVGALLMRAVFIFVGLELIHRFEWILYVFGLFLIYAGVRLGIGKEEKMDPEKSWVISTFHKFMPFTTTIKDHHFFNIENGHYVATPLFLALLAVETTDVIFALDSIPAIFGITRDPFIVYTSNIFAILGLRSLFFVLSGAMELFHFLHYGLSLILVMIGCKMIAEKFIDIPTTYTLGFVLGVLSLCILFSILFPQKE